MEDNEKLKALVLSRCAEAWEEYICRVWKSDDKMVFGEFRLTPLVFERGTPWHLASMSGTIAYTFEDGIPASDPVWALVAPVLGIQIEATIDPPLA